VTHISVLALCEGTGSDNDIQNESEPDDFNPKPESPDSAASNGQLLSSTVCVCAYFK